MSPAQGKSPTRSIKSQRFGDQFCDVDEPLLNAASVAQAG